MNIPENKYLGKLCKRGHNWNNIGKSLRDMNGTCCQCMKEFNKVNGKKYKKKYYQNHKEKVKEYNQKYQQEHKLEIKERRSQYGKNHRDKINIYMKPYLAKYVKEHRVELNEKQKIKYKSNMTFKLNLLMANAINRALGGRKNRQQWEYLVGYAVEDLKQYLEKQFKDGMTWNNYGKDGWHIDHIIPKSVFNFSSPEHIDFKRCWALSNLQPMWAKENIKKQAKLDKPFQPSLALGYLGEL